MIQLCLRYTKNDDDATEVLNNAFLKVFHNLQRYNPTQGSLYTWIRTIVVHSCIDFVQKNMRTVQYYDFEEEAEIMTDPEVINKMDVMRLLHFIRQLPAATQAVFNLFAIEGYKHKEIGQLLRISEGTSKWHLSEARKKLQQMILSEEVEI